jgi:spermidine synthase
MGFTGTLAQVILIRELLVTFYGNELSIGIILANWLILEAVGSFFLGRIGNKSNRNINIKVYVLLQFAIAVLLPLVVYGARVVKNMLGIPPGEMVGLFPIFYASLLLLAPLSLAGGAQFTIGCRIYSDLTKEASPSIARVYIYEAIGAMVGGLLLTFLIIPYFHSIEVAFAVSGLNLISAILLIVLWEKFSFTLVKVEHQFWMNIRRSFLRRGMWFLFTSIILLASTSYLLFSPKADEIDRLSIETHWRGYELQYYKNSNYGNIAITKSGGEFTFYSDGIPIATSPNPDESFIEELAHFPMLLHYSPDKVLIVGGGVGGLINEVVKHPVEKVDYTELDPLIIEAVQRFATPLTNFELGNPKVAINNIDGRLFISRSQEQYDVIIINLPSPSNLQLNRFYTKEFFKIADARLSSDGILVITCPGSLSYLSEELANLNACIYQTMLDIFPYVRVIPGELNLFLASPSVEISNAEPALLVQRFQERALKTKLLSDFHIQYKLDMAKENWFLDSIDQATEIRINRDFAPSGLLYDISLWSALVSEFFGNALKLVGKVNLWVFLIPLAIFVVAHLALRRRIPKLETSSIGIAIVATGFTGMAFNMVLILAFQSLFGYVYQIIALIIAAFMLGLAIGNTIISRLMNRVSNNKLLFIKLESMILAYSILVPVVLIIFHANLGQPAISILVQVVILILSVIPGILVGAEFPLANKIYLRDAEPVGRVGGMLYACDLVGAWVGALLVGIWLIPVLGIISTCILIACLKLASLALVAISRL